MYGLDEYKHDVERFSADLAKLAVIRDHEKNNSSLMVARLQAINALSLCMSAKTSFLNYLDLIQSDGNDIEIEERRHSFVRSIERCSYSAKHLFHLHHGKNGSQTIKLERETYAEFKGPDFFEFIPFAILDNAVKYCIRDGGIEIRMFENSTHAIADFTSIGPIIEADETEKIFELGYRGRHARRTGMSGDGIGLYHAREAVRSAFGGELSLTNGTSNTFSIGDVECSHNTFRLEIPLG